jgi:deoxyribose-phosphate aldolase
MSNNRNEISGKELADCIDHTLISATATSEQIRRLCNEAMSYSFCAVAVNPRWVSLAADILSNSKVKVDSVVGFPLGAETTKIKVEQAKELVLAGADEIDMVADLAAIMEADNKYLSGEIMAVLRVCRSMKPKVVLKVIIEAAALGTEQKVFACRICQQAGVDFIKTSTGLHPVGGANIEDVRLIKQIAPRCKVKASGGIRTMQDVLDMLEAGADRIGTSSAIQIIAQFKERQLK